MSLLFLIVAHVVEKCHFCFSSPLFTAEFAQTYRYITITSGCDICSAFQVLNLFKMAAANARYWWEIKDLNF
jgi:hypothetical protein